jgi:membrane-bound lytic murein transglycosylase B
VLVPCLLALGVGGACAGDDGDASAAATSSADAARPTTTATTAPTPTTTAAPFDPWSLRPPPPAADPAALAAQIADAEADLHDAAANEASVAAAALAQQVAYRQLGDHPEWDAAVDAALPAALRPVAAAHAAARRDLRALGRPKPQLPDWQIVAPAPLAELEADYRDADAATGVPWTYLAAVHLVETGTGRIRGTSDAGAQGPMQFLPSTWAAYGAGGDIHSTRDAIFGAARYLAANGAPGDMGHALYRYNHSDRYVRAVTRYAELLAGDPLALRALYHWGVWYRTVDGDVYLPVGYGS